MEETLISNEKAHKRGGSRPGAGRKAFVEKIPVNERKELLKITEAKFWVEKAETVATPFVMKLVDDVTATKEVRFKAAQEILNRAIGKPKEYQEHSGTIVMQKEPEPEQVERFTKRHAKTDGG